MKHSFRIWDSCTRSIDSCTQSIDRISRMFMIHIQQLTVEIIHIQLQFEGWLAQRCPFSETCNCFLNGSFEECFEASVEAMGCVSSCKNMSAPGTATHAASIVCLCVCLSQRLIPLLPSPYPVTTPLLPPFAYTYTFTLWGLTPRAANITHVLIWILSATHGHSALSQIQWVGSFIWRFLLQQWKKGAQSYRVSKEMKKNW